VDVLRHVLLDDQRRQVLVGRQEFQRARERRFGDAQVPRRTGRGVEVHHKALIPLQPKGGGQMNRHRRFAHTTFLIPAGQANAQP
jgi:hypothetical protein